MDSSSDNQLMELAVTPTSYEDLLDAQRDLFQNQMEKLQELVAVQCKLTGVNPLSQEMAAAALSIKIGKRPRDLMNPKAVKYMQYVFSIKDSINKRESREISARFGVTVTQVRDFFTSQRSRVRKLARLCGEKANMSRDSITSTSDSSMALCPIPYNVIVPANTDEGASNSKSLDMLSKMEESDFHFTKNIFSSMKKEETFGEQVKLLRWILHIKNPSVLDWFLIEGGLMILATWLTEAAKEEQTSFLKVIMKVLHYLPLRNALPAHVSAILQSVNRLRFYRISDISHRARVLLSNWSKIFGKSLSSKKNNGVKSASYLQDEMLLKRSIREVLGNESWDLKDENSDASLGLLCDNPDKLRVSLPAPPLKLLTAPGDESDKKRGGLPSYSRERRKVQILEQPGQKSSSRNFSASKITPATQSRPLSADDIQKAKMRAQFMQSKYGKTTSSTEKVKPENQNRSDTSSVNLLPSVSKFYADNRTEGQKKIENAESRVADLHDAQPLNMEEPPMKKFKKQKIPWQIPSEMKMSEEWHFASGESSKEVEIQNNRNRREREVLYMSQLEIPSNPREPWDREMDHDDSLTPEIPTEQLPDIEPLEMPPSVSRIDSKEVTAPVASTSSAAATAPDFELLAALLKNPELVFALTSGKSGAISSEDTVKLLDMIKSSGLNSNGAGLTGSGSSKPEVSLPSPTPSSDSARNGVKPPELSRNPFSRHHNLSNSTEYQTPGGATLPLRHQGINTVVLPPPPATAATQLGGSSVQLQGQWPVPSSNPLIQHQHQHLLSSSRPNSPNVQQHLTTEMMVKANTHWAGSNTVWTEPSVNVRPSSHTHHLQLQPQYPLQSPYAPEHRVSNPILTAFETNRQGNNYNRVPTGRGGLVQAHVNSTGIWSGRNNVGGGGYESWSPDNSPTRRQPEYIPGQYYSEAGLTSMMQQQRSERSVTQTPSSMYQDPSLSSVGVKRYFDRR